MAVKPTRRLGLSGVLGVLGFLSFALLACDPAPLDLRRHDARPELVGDRVGDGRPDAGPQVDQTGPPLDVPAPGDVATSPRADVADLSRPELDASAHDLPARDASARSDARTPSPSESDLELQARLFGAREVIAVEIELDEAALSRLMEDPHSDYVTANITVDGHFLNRVGLKLKGGRGSFRRIDQKAAFKVDLNRFTPGQDLGGLRKLTFNNMIQDTTQSRERLTALAFQHLGLPVGRVGYAELSVNGENYGLYSHVETLDEAFLERAFPGDGHGNLYEGFDDHDLWLRDLVDFDQDAGDDVGKVDLRHLVSALDAATPATLDETVGEIVDLPLVRRFFAAEILTGHWDGYAQLRNNYYVYARPSDGRFVFLPSGTDQAWQRTNSPYGGPGRLFRMCVDWLPCRLPYAEVVRESALRLADFDFAAELERLAALLEAPFSRDRKTPTRAPQRQTDLVVVRDFIAGHFSRMSGGLTCLDPAQDADQDLVLRCAGDCNDANPSIYAGAYDTCDDDVDQDCSQFTDDGWDCPTCREAVAPSGRLHLYCHRLLRFSPARASCRTLGAELLSLHDDAENLFAGRMAGARRATRWWLGGQDFTTEGTFIWEDQTAFDYSAWAPGEPNDNGGYEDCIALQAGENATWNDQYVGVYAPFICARD